MNTTRLKALFANKVCTILTTIVAKTNFEDQQFSDFFTGYIEDIDQYGIYAKHHITGCHNFYAWPHVVSILEEQVIQEDDPQYENILKEIQNKPVQNVGPTNSSPFINPDSMASLAQQAKEVQNSMLGKN